MTDKGANKDETAAVGHEARKPQDMLGDFETLFSAISAVKEGRAEPVDRTGIIYLAPEEIGINPTVKGDRIAFQIGPLKGGEIGEIREQIKDFEEPHYSDEYYREICLRGIVSPKIPDDARGRRFMDEWLPGTRQVVAQAVLNQTGMGLHDVKSAKDELGKLLAMTRSTA